jgi:hypothetical protein
MKGKKMKLISYSKANSRSANSRRRADYVRVCAFECVRVRVRDADYDHVEKFF